MIPASAEPPVPLRRNRDFQLFWTSQVLSTLGTRGTAVALPLLVLAETGSPARAGLVGFAQTLPFLVLFLPAGVIVDRADRKRIMLAAEVIRVAALAAISLVVVSPGFMLWLVLVAAFAEGAASIFFELSESAALPHLVPRPQIPRAIAQNQARQEGADLVGQPVGGALFGLQPVAPFLFDAFTYVVSFVALMLVRPELQDRRDDAVDRSRRLVGDVAEGITFLWGQRLLRTIVLLVGGWNFVSNALVLVLIVRARELGAGPGGVGLLLAMFGGGALVGAVLAPTIQERVAGRVVVIGAVAVNAVAMAAMAVAPSVVGLAAAIAVSGAVGTPFNVVIGSYRYALTPDRLQGRVLSAARVVAWGTIPLGALAAGFALEAIGATTSLRLLAALMAVVALATVAAPSVRTMPPGAGPSPA